VSLRQVTPVTFDINVLVGAVVKGNSSFRHWPSPPPVSTDAEGDCVGIINDAREFSLWLSPYILETIVLVLTGEPPAGYGWESERAAEYIGHLADMALDSGGGVITPTTIVADCTDPEDNTILALALDSGSALIVSSDHHLLDMRVWRNVPIITPREFASRTDVLRRTRKE
jgi:hypothetical protein